MRKNNKKTSRPLFTDGWNSFWHVFFGVIAVRYLILVPIFIVYQLIDFYEVNLFVDLAEFFFGFFIAWILASIIRPSSPMLRILRL
jgi:hypothetical protein